MTLAVPTSRAQIETNKQNLNRSARRSTEKRDRTSGQERGDPISCCPRNTKELRAKRHTCFLPRRFAVLHALVSSPQFRGILQVELRRVRRPPNPVHGGGRPFRVQATNRHGALGPVAVSSRTTGQSLGPDQPCHAQGLSPVRVWRIAHRTSQDDYSDNENRKMPPAGNRARS